MRLNEEGKTNIKTLEDVQEIFVDLIDDLGVYDLEEGESVTYGTYSNQFTCIYREHEIKDGVERVDQEIAALFYENEEIIKLKLVKLLDANEGDMLDIEMYWFDESGSDTPSSNPHWLTILENMDIFLDEL